MEDKNLFVLPFRTTTNIIILTDVVKRNLCVSLRSTS